MANIKSGLIDSLKGRYVILEEDGLYWAAEVVDIQGIPASENYCDVAHKLASVSAVPLDAKAGIRDRSSGTGCIRLICGVQQRLQY